MEVSPMNDAQNFLQDQTASSSIYPKEAHGDGKNEGFNAPSCIKNVGNSDKNLLPSTNSRKKRFKPQKLDL